MSLYPRRYKVSSNENNSTVIQFDWDVPGYSTWGAKLIFHFIKHHLNIKETKKIISAFESLIAFEFNSNEFIIYQGDDFLMEGLEIRALNEKGEKDMPALINVFNKSMFFKNNAT